MQELSVSLHCEMINECLIDNYWLLENAFSIVRYLTLFSENSGYASNLTSFWIHTEVYIELECNWASVFLLTCVASLLVSVSPHLDCMQLVSVTKCILIKYYFPNYFKITSPWNLEWSLEDFRFKVFVLHVLFIIFAPWPSSEVLSRSLCPGNAGIPSPVSHAGPKRWFHCLSLIRKRYQFKAKKNDRMIITKMCLL